jgi:hypothetical protein
MPDSFCIQGSTHPGIELYHRRTRWTNTAECRWVGRPDTTSRGDVLRFPLVAGFDLTLSTA